MIGVAGQTPATRAQVSTAFRHLDPAFVGFTLVFVRGRRRILEQEVRQSSERRGRFEAITYLKADKVRGPASAARPELECAGIQAGLGTVGTRAMSRQSHTRSRFRVTAVVAQKATFECAEEEVIASRQERRVLWLASRANRQLD
jgi:hypothetical protein